ncbi:hypothetical protein FOZ76_20860 [Verticiella sediminum]|uniref:DUF2189 domain-containing protein n=1 Tax=Verticiella sediminum TaxID=1247510 RepID=A0A556ABN5_9BURK|nr:BPSS1780 family membrane protein [Verticiella sediminum]TSH90283.1 hypothetical protein FOZ76_20860 [Verticiella sediminum]
MQAKSLTPLAGWYWVRDGFRLFRRQPIAMFTWALAIGLVVLLASLMVPIGPVMFVVLMPSITMMTLHACRQIENGTPVKVLGLVQAWRNSGKVRPLLVAGAVYVASVLLAGLLAFVPFLGSIAEAAQAVDVTGPSADMAPFFAALQMPLAIFGVLYLLIAALFWHAPVLIAWHDMDLRKAMFFSGIACWRNKGAFVLYGLVWAVLLLALELFARLLSGIGLPGEFVGILQMPLNFALAAGLYCSFYPTYTTVFGEP